MKTKLIFTERSLPFILEALGKTTDKKEYVIDVKSKKFVLDADGKKFKKSKLIGIIGKKWITNIFQIDYFNKIGV